MKGLKNMEKERIKKALVGFVAGCVIGSFIGITASSLTGCQSVARSMGGDITIELDPGEKLEEITWKDDSLWYLTRPMRPNEKAETHVFEQSSNFGIIEGSVTIIESEE